MERLKNWFRDQGLGPQDLPKVEPWRYQLSHFSVSVAEEGLPVRCCSRLLL